ncbi:MAG: M28 family peptidase [Vulcanimicrobiaceae bacterium]
MNLLRYGALAATMVLTAGAAPSYDATFLTLPSAEGALQTSRVINARMHYPGTPGDRALALYMGDRLRAFGFDVRIEPFTVDVFTPKLLSLELLTSPKTAFDLHEASSQADSDASRPDAGVPFNSGSGSGDVTARVVYAGRGLEDDYATLSNAGVTVHGKIVLVRYGAQFRGILAHRAQDHGAAGVIFYSDPADDGFGKGAVYPKGPYRPLGSVQRGSVGVPPLTIPSLPITAANAKILLASMRGTAAPAAWKGALDAPYVLGASAVPVHLQVEMNVKPTTLWNTVGTLPGKDPSQSVVMGGHRDAWVYGVTDNGSGISTLLEVARGLGSLHEKGWRPERSIVIAGFDAEEIGELGSEAYAKTHASAIGTGCVAYINADEVTSGQRFGSSAAAALTDAVTGAVKSVPDPAGKAPTLYARWQQEKGGAVVRPPAGGSDFETFIYDYGVPIVDVGFGGPLGAYHSAYDDFDYASKIADPGFVNHRAVAQVIGELAMQLADSPAIPYRFGGYAPAFEQGLAKLVARAKVAGVAFDGRPLQSAIAHFASVANAFDAHPNPAHNANALRAVRELNRTLYGRNGYASVTLPAVAAALDAADAARLSAAVKVTAAALDRDAGLLE